MAKMMKVKIELPCKSWARGKVREMDRSLKAFETMLWTLDFSLGSQEATEGFQEEGMI